MEQIGQEKIGRYKIGGELGRGAMGVVYRATDPSIGRTVAIKTIRIRDINDTQEREKLRDRLFREARSAGVLSHPNIVTIYDMDEDEGIAYIAMAFVNGPTLETILSSEEPLSGARMLRILRQAASALDYAHSKGIVHRDVKPANIMTDEDGSVKITDFGIARIAAGVHATNETKTISGTPNYMSPEQVQGLVVDGRSDQFSLAVIAYEILTGERPFTGEHLSTIVYKIVTEEQPAAHRLNGTLTQRIDDVLRKALSKNPDNRFPSCSNFVGALELACAESRGWKTLPAGASAEQPTIAVHPAGIAHSPGAVHAPVAAAADKSRSHSRMLPVLMSILVVSALGALFVYQSGLAGRAPDPEPVQTQQEVAKKINPPAEPDTVSPNTVPPDAKPPEMKAPDAQNPGLQTPAVPAQDVKAPTGRQPETLPVSEKPAQLEPVKAQFEPPEPLHPATRVSQARLQDIWIATNPPGAKVVLDENEAFSCLAPCQLHGAPGVHRVAISLPGFLSEFREIRVGDSALDLGTLALRQPMGTLMLTTTPAGATIRINGELVPKLTPAELPLKPGSYAVTVEKDGASRTERIQVRENPFYLRIPLNR